MNNNEMLRKINKRDNDIVKVNEKLDNITKNKYDDVIISGNELSMKANGVVKKTIQLPSAGETVEGHTHSNKSILDNITNNKVNNWDSAYEHSQSSHTPANAQKNSDITKSEIEAKLVGEISSHTHDYAESDHNHDAVYSKLGHNHSKTDIADMPTKLSEFQNDIGMGNGVTPNITIGTVTTLEAGQQATVVKRGTIENPIFDFGIPKGENGSNGERGEQGANGKSVELTKTATHIKWRHAGQSEGVGWTDLVALEDIKGTFDTTTIFNSLNTTNKTIIGAINELFALIKNNGSGSENTTTSGIKVEPTSVNIKVNGTADVTISFGSDVTNKTIEFISSSGAIASVSELGSYKYRITGVGQGQTSIKFRTSDGKFETSCSVTVASSSTSGGGTGGGSTSGNISNASETAITQQYSTSHEATPNNPNPPAGAYNWLTKPRINPDGSFPQSTWNAIGHWMTTYKVQGSSYYDNVGLLLQDPKAWIWNTTTRSWDVLSDDFEWGTWYREDFWDDGSGNITGTTQWETGVSGNHSKWVKIKQTSESSGRCFHPWGYQKNWRSNSNWANNGQPYIVTKVDFKLIKYDENGVDNLDKARLVVNSGADWWRNVGDTWQPDWSTNRDMAVGKYILATKELKRAWCTNLPQSWSYGFPE